MRTFFARFPHMAPASDVPEIDAVPVEVPEVQRPEHGRHHRGLRIVAALEEPRGDRAPLVLVGVDVVRARGPRDEVGRGVEEDEEDDYDDAEGEESEPVATTMANM